MKLLNTFLNKVSKKDFKNMIKSVAALKLFASSMQDEDILRSLYVLSFNDIPNKDFSIKEAITRRADAKEKLNLVERQLIAKEVCTILKNASALFDSELANITNNDNNFIQPKNPEFIKSAKFGLLANVNGKYHLVNPLTSRVASEFIIEAADERYAKLHELVGQYRKENKISYFDESDGMMILTGSPEVINDVEHKVKDIGYYCESVNEETGADGEVPEYSLKIFTNTTAAPEFDIEKEAAKHEKVGEDSKFSYWLQLEDNYNDDGYLDSKNVGDHLGFFYATEKGTQAPALLVSQLGFSGDGLSAQRTYPTKSKEPGKTYLYEEYGYTDDDFSEVYNFLNDGLKNVSPEMNQKNLDGLTVDNIDTTNPNLKKDNPMLNTEGAMGEVVEKTSAEKSVEKKAVSDSFYTGYSSNRTMDELGYAADAFKQVCDEFGIPIENLNFFREAYPEYTDVYSYNPQLKHCTLKDGPVYDMCVRHLQGHIPDDSDVYFEFTPGTELFDVFVNGNLDKELSNLLNDNDEVLDDYYELMKELNSRLLRNVHWETGTKLFDDSGYYILAKKTTTINKKAEEKIDFEKELMEAGESKGKKDKVNKEQLEMGKKVEKEHTTNPAIAEKITRDHLAEIPDYYTHLEEMENNAKKNNEVKSSYAPFITIDATTTDEVKVVAGEKVVGTCKTIQAAFEELEKTAGESYGWYVDPREAQEKLDLWIEAVGAEKALDDLRYALDTDELSECLAFIFRNNDFKQGCSDTDEDSDVESAKEENINKKADQELKQFDMKQELDGQKEFEKQDDSLKDVSIPEEKEDTSEVNEAMSAKPTQNKGESFSASEFGNNLAYIKQNNPEDFESIMANLKQLMVGDQKPMYDFLELWSQNNFQNFTETTRVDPTYERHSQYQEQLKNNVLPKVMEMSEYKKAMEEKVSAEKGNVESAKEENIEKKAEKETKEEYVDSEGHTHTIITKVDKNREHPYIFEHLIDGQWASTSYNDFPVDLKEEIEHIKRVYPINPEGN